MCNPSIRASVKKLPCERRPNEARDLDSSLLTILSRRGNFFLPSVSYYSIFLISVDPLWLTELKDFHGFVNTSRLHSIPLRSTDIPMTIPRADITGIRDAVCFRKMPRRKINANKDADLFNPPPPSNFTTSGRLCSKFLRHCSASASLFQSQKRRRSLLCDERLKEVTTWHYFV